MPKKLPGAQAVIYAAIASNVAIALSKFAAAAVTGSSAMLAESLHSLVDTGNELLLLLGVRRSLHVADEWHPFGYGKAIYFWAFIVALLVFALGGGISIYHGMVGLYQPPPLHDPGWNYVVLAVAAFFEAISWHVSRCALEQRRRPGENLWQAVQRSADPSVFTVFVEDSAALIGIAIAALGIALSHAFAIPALDPAASVLIGLVLLGAAAILARKCSRLLVGESIDREQIVQLRRLIAADAAVERVDHLLTMQLGPDNVLLTASVRFQRQLSLDAVEQAIERLEMAIKTLYPSIQHLFLESGALKRLPPADSTAPVATDGELSAMNR